MIPVCLEMMKEADMYSLESFHNVKDHSYISKLYENLVKITRKIYSPFYYCEDFTFELINSRVQTFNIDILFLNRY